MAAGIINLVSNDLLPTLVVDYEDADITGFEIFLNVQKEDGSRFQRQATILNVGDPPNQVPASFEFEWEAGDLTPGKHAAEIELFDGVVGQPATKNETWNGLLLDVDKELG